MASGGPVGRLISSAPPPSISSAHQQMFYSHPNSSHSTISSHHNNIHRGVHIPGGHSGISPHGVHGPMQIGPSSHSTHLPTHSSSTNHSSLQYNNPFYHRYPTSSGYHPSGGLPGVVSPPQVPPITSQHQHLSASPNSAAVSMYERPPISNSGAGTYPIQTLTPWGRYSTSSPFVHLAHRVPIRNVGPSLWERSGSSGSGGGMSMGMNGPPRTVRIATAASMLHSHSQSSLRPSTMMMMRPTEMSEHHHHHHQQQHHHETSSSSAAVVTMASLPTSGPHSFRGNGARVVLPCSSAPSATSSIAGGGSAGGAGAPPGYRREDVSNNMLKKQREKSRYCGLTVPTPNHPQIVITVLPTVVVESRIEFTVTCLVRVSWPLISERCW